MRTRLPLTVVNGGQDPLYPMRSVETLLISPDAFDSSKPIAMTANGRVVAEKRVEPSGATLMNWAARDNDRTMLFGAELQVALK